MESMLGCPGFKIVWGGLVFRDLRRWGFGYFLHLMLVVDMVIFAVMTGLFRADTTQFHDHVRGVLSVHLTLVVVRVAYICATKP